MENWNEIEAALRNCSGEAGAEERAAAYAPFFQRFGRGVRVGAGCRFRNPERIVLDDGAAIGDGCHFDAESAIWIGRAARIGACANLHSDVIDPNSVHPDRFAVIVDDLAEVPPAADLGPGSHVVRAAQKPARVSSDEAACVSLVVPANDRRLIDAAHLLVEVLGLPQLCVALDSELLLERTSAAILFGGSPKLPVNIPVWRLETGARDAAARARTLNLPDGSPAGLPASIAYDIGHNGFGETPGLRNTTRATLSVALGRDLNRDAEEWKLLRPGWGLVLLGANMICPEDDRWDEIFERVGPILHPRMEGANWREFAQVALDDIWEHELDLMAEKAPGIRKCFANPKEHISSMVWEGFRRAIHTLPLFVHRWRDKEPEICEKVLAFQARGADSSPKVACAAMGYLALGRDHQARRMLDEILVPPWTASYSSLLRTKASDDLSPGATPEALALLLAFYMKDMEGSLFSSTPTVALRWRSCGNGNAFADSRSRVLSRDLLDNWLLLQELPELAEGAVRRSEISDNLALTAIEEAWHRAIEAIFDEIGEKLVRLKPWPAGYRAAFALRFDVDRDASNHAIAAISSVQKNAFNAACGSWYYLADAGHNPHVRGSVGGANQEDGLHSDIAGEDCEGRGVTPHGGLRSSYWTGANYVRSFDGRAPYTETMGAAFLLPRRAWTAQGALAIWVTPTYFALEGNLRDHTTEFFDRRLDAFRTRLANGGLVIVGTHPDCSQQLLADVLAREDLLDVWPTRIDKAVERVKRLFGYGNVRVLKRPDGFALEAKFDVADVAVTIREPKGGVVRDVAVHLKANEPAPLEQRTVPKTQKKPGSRSRRARSG